MKPNNFDYFDIGPELPDHCKNTPCVRGVISTILNREEVMLFHEKLSEHRILQFFDINVESLKVGARTWTNFTPLYLNKMSNRPINYREAKDSLNALLSALREEGKPVIWKQGSKGFLLDEDNLIIQDWELDPF